MIIIKFALTGAFLGLAAGISPGPLLTLVITETLRHNSKAGIKVAVSPLITDLPIILVTLLIITELSQFNTILGIISFLGGVFVAYLGIESLKTKGLSISGSSPESLSLKKGIIANLFNPHPYLFWATVGTPYIFKASGISILALILFLGSFYIMLTGSKIAVAIITAKSKSFINQKSYIIMMRMLGLALLVFSVMFFYDGYKYMKAI